MLTARQIVRAAGLSAILVINDLSVAPVAQAGEASKATRPNIIFAQNDVAREFHPKRAQNNAQPALRGRPDSAILQSPQRTQRALRPGIWIIQFNM